MTSLSAKARHDMTAWVREMLGPEKALVWWRTINPMLGSLSPAEMVMMGREQKLYDFIYDSYHCGGNLPPPASPEPERIAAANAGFLAEMAAENQRLQAALEALSLPAQTESKP